MTVKEITKNLLDDEYRKCGWNADQPLLCDARRPHVLIPDNYVYEGITLLFCILCSLILKMMTSQQTMNLSTRGLFADHVALTRFRF